MRGPETLRRAAALMRERLGGATSGPWAVGVDPESGERNVVYSEFVASRYATADPTVARIVGPQYPQPDDEGEPEYGQASDAEHIAALSPEVIDLMAVLLDGIAVDFTDDEDYADNDFVSAALAVASAYLGETHEQGST